MKIIRFILKATLAVFLGLALLVSLWVGALVVLKRDSKLHDFLLQKAFFTCLYLSRDGRLELAVWADDVARVERALRQGAHANFQERDGDTFLMWVCEKHQPHSYALAKALLEHGADPNIQDDLGSTALMYAAYNRPVEIVQLLLQHGARADVTNSRGETALSIAKFWQNKNGTLLTLLEEAMPQPATNRAVITLPLKPQTPESATNEVAR